MKPPEILTQLNHSSGSSTSTDGLNKDSHKETSPAMIFKRFKGEGALITKCGVNRGHPGDNRSGTQSGSLRNSGAWSKVLAGYSC